MWTPATDVKGDRRASEDGDVDDDVEISGHEDEEKNVPPSVGPSDEMGEKKAFLHLLRRLNSTASPPQIDGLEQDRCILDDGCNCLLALARASFSSLG